MQKRRSFLASAAISACAAGVATLSGHAAPETNENKAMTSVACAVDGYNYQKPALKQGSRLLFIGDSITDMNWGRNESDRNHYLGHSYVFLLAGRLGVEMPDAKLDIYNRGKSGNAVWQLRKRWQKDAVDMKPDLLTILIGTNDIGQGLRKPKDKITPAAFEADYRFILDASRKANPELRLVLLDPFVLPTGGLKNQKAYSVRRALTDELRVVVAKLAKDYDAVHIKTQDIFDKAAKASAPEYFIWDGIHPLPAGHELIARHWIHAVSKRWHQQD